MKMKLLPLLLASALLAATPLIASAQASAANLGWEPDDAWMLCMPIARIGGLSILTRALAARRHP